MNFNQMKISSGIVSSYLAVIMISFSCVPDKREKGTTRLPVDTVGFAQYAWQMDSIMLRIEKNFMYEELHPCEYQTDKPVKIVISPHDDYCYVGSLYPAVIQQIESPLVVMFGVAHKARQFNLEDKIIFDTHAYWKGPYGDVLVSPLRESIISGLEKDQYIVHDSIHIVEHSLEALIPFLQYFNKKVEIIPILVPCMSFDRMSAISVSLAKAVDNTAEQYDLKWGKDFCMIISNDAVHYGDEDWGENNYAFYGADTAGYKAAVSYEREIITSTLCGHVNPDKVKKFCEYTVRPDNYKEYKWTWCGRYALPLGLLTAYHLAAMDETNLYGTEAGYMTSVDHPHISVEDLRMGTTAPATIHHWVGYVGVIYK